MFYYFLIFDFGRKELEGTKHTSHLFMKATAKAHPNIALVKYWGKRDQKLNLPAVGSISVTLNKLHTISSVHFREDLQNDILILNGEEAKPDQTLRISRFLDLIRHKAGISTKAEVSSKNNFPTGAGLASSASAFASLALAGSQAAGLQMQASALSELARLGSGSAARSIFGGFAEMKVGERADGSDAVAVPLADENHWDLRILIAITSEEEKEIGSTTGMNHTARTSPYYGQWVFSSQADLENMRRAIFLRNFTELGQITELSCLKMHAVAMSANPGLIYWNSTTVEAIHTIRKLRNREIPVYFTIDAGPQIKALCPAPYSEEVHDALQKISGVLRIIETSLGPAAALTEEMV